MHPFNYSIDCPLRARGRKTPTTVSTQSLNWVERQNVQERADLFLEGKLQPFRLRWRQSATCAANLRKLKQHFNLQSTRVKMLLHNVLGRRELGAVDNMVTW